MTTNRLKERVAIITGGSSGIGKATALKFAREGARIALWDIEEEKGLELVQVLKELGAEAAFYKVNTANLTQVEAATKVVIDTFGQIDILINNAGITRDATMKKITPEQWQSVIDVNLTGVFNCTKAVHPYMIEKGYGRIVSASSVVGLYGNFGQTNYVASKAAVIGMTKVWAREFGKYGITANAVAPGFIATEMMLTIPEHILDGFRAKTPLRRLGTVEEVANVYLFLSSEEASFVNGSLISVDGGVTV